MGMRPCPNRGLRKQALFSGLVPTTVNLETQASQKRQKDS